MILIEMANYINIIFSCFLSYIYVQSFLGEVAVGKYGTGLLQYAVLVVVACAEMSEQKLAGVSVTGYCRSLFRCGMIV